jgi:hypothetical protein
MVGGGDYENQEQGLSEAFGGPAVGASLRDDQNGHEPEYQGEYGGNLSATLSAVIPLLIGIGCSVAALQLPLGTLSKPGAGLWPLACGTAAAMASLALLTFRHRLEHPEKFTRHIWAVGVGVVSLAAFTALMPLVGFEIPLLLLFLLWLKVLGREKWRISILVSVCCTAGFYLLFILGLQLRIPHLI